MAWIESHQSLLTHRKTRRVAAALGCDRFKLIGHLHALWWWGLDNVPADGYLGDLTDEEIAWAAQWEDDPGRFTQALVAAGFVDVREDGRYLHDWYHYAGKLIDSRGARKSANMQRREEAETRIYAAIIRLQQSGVPVTVRAVAEAAQAGKDTVRRVLSTLGLSARDQDPEEPDAVPDPVPGGVPDPVPGQRTVPGLPNPTQPTQPTKEEEEKAPRAQAHEVGGDESDLVRQVTALWEQEMGQLPSPSIVDTLIDDYLRPLEPSCASLPWDVVAYAIREAVAHDARTLAYVRTLLDDWQQHRVQTVAQAQARQAAFRGQRPNGHARDRPRTASVPYNPDDPYVQAVRRAAPWLQSEGE